MRFALILALGTATAHADTRFDEHGAGTSRRASEQLFEAACDVDVVLRGAVATVEVRQRIVNPGPGALALHYQFDLATGATVTGFTLKTAGRTDAALPLPARATTTRASTPDVLAADPGRLVWVEGDTYAIDLQPIAADGEVIATTRYTALADVRNGALRLVLPGRANVGKLTACRGTARASAGPGASIGAFRIGGVSGKGAFTIDTAPVVIEAPLVIAGSEPIAWTQTEALGDGWNATVLTVAAPAVRTATAGARRALFVIDGSRSMELVGRHHTSRVVRAVASALPAGTTVDAILYDRTASRTFGAWKPATTDTLDAIDTQVRARPSANGSDLRGALAVAKAAIEDGAREATMVIVISDGVLGEVDGRDLTAALDGKTSTVDVIAVVLDPAKTRSPGAAAVRAPVSLYGGAFIEIGVEEIDDALTAVDEWLRPSWLDLAITADVDLPATVRAGSGFVRTLIHKGPARLVLTGGGASKLTLRPRPLASTPVATLALARDRGATELPARALRHRWANAATALAVLTRTGKVAANRFAMVKGGGPYERLVVIDDDLVASAPVVQGGGSVTVPSAIAKDTLRRLFREQLQPKAYVCYQRALGLAPKLGGTATFTLHLGRGELTQASLVGLGDPTFDACLLDAAYGLSVPMPDFTVNADDQTIATYPITFQLADNKPTIVAGDADSSSPLDIDAIEGGVPARDKPVTVNSKTPLGDMRPSKN